MDRAWSPHRGVLVGVGILAASWAAAATAPRPRPAARPQAAPAPTPTARPAPSPAPTAARTLAIAHEEVGCVIVGKFPQFSACFEPATDLAKADMYFRSVKNASWFRVPFVAEGKCHKAVLPKPGKVLVKTDLLLYASGASRQWGEARTREYAVKVVESESECKGEKPVAPWVPSANVTVFPSLPTGFALGGGGLPLLPIVGGAAVVGGGAAAATQLGGDGGSDGGGPGGGATTSTPTPTPLTPTPTPSTGDLPPTLVCRTTPDPPEGGAPFTVELNLCRSEDPEGRPLSYRFDFGDGGTATGFCRESHTYGTVGSYTARLCITDGTHPELCCSETIKVTAAPSTPPPGGGGSCAAPTISITAPGTGFSFVSGAAVRVAANASAPAGVAKVDFKVQNLDTGAATTATDTSAPYEWIWDTSKTGPGRTEVGATVHDQCASGSQQASASVLGTVTISLAPDRPLEGGALLVSELDLEGGSGRVVHNQSRLAFLRAGRSGWMQDAPAGTNRIEATVAQGHGAGTWRFTLAGRAFRRGSVRVLEGEVSLMTADTVVFRLAGRAGERLVFTFEPAP